MTGIIASAGEQVAEGFYKFYDMKPTRKSKAWEKKRHPVKVAVRRPKGRKFRPVQDL